MTINPKYLPKQIKETYTVINVRLIKINDCKVYETYTQYVSLQLMNKKFMLFILF